VTTRSGYLQDGEKSEYLKSFCKEQRKWCLCWFLKWLMVVVVVNFRSEMWRRKNSFGSIWRAVFQSNNVIDSVGKRTKLKMHKKNCSSFNLMCFLIWFDSILFLNLKLCFPIVKDGVTVMTKSGENTTVRRRDDGDGEVEHER
jgi:hypothetical protein